MIKGLMLEAARTFKHEKKSFTIKEDYRGYINRNGLYIIYQNGHGITFINRRPGELREAVPDIKNYFRIKKEVLLKDKKELNEFLGK
jgi:hypothetical protein